MYNEKTQAFEMRKSRILEKMRAGDTAYSFKINIESPKSVEIAAMFGFDCVWLDMEHVATDWSVCEKQIMAAKMYNTDTLVRVAKGSYNDFIKPLELDAAAIMVPHLFSADEARDIVKKTRFHPLGRRPVDGGNADGAYCNIDFKKYIKQANEQRCVMVQIEDPEPLNELDEICRVEGIDVIFFGPGDFSQGIGTPGDFANPEIARVKELVAKTARKYGKFAGTVGSADNHQQLVDMGYTFISIGADVVALSNYCSDIMNKIK